MVDVKDSIIFLRCIDCDSDYCNNYYVFSYNYKNND